MLMNVRHEITPRGAILLVIPSVVLVEDGKFRVEADFYNNLRVYLRNFDRVVFACPALTSQNNQGYIIRSVPLEELPQRARYVPLPYTYREDTHLRNYLPTR